MSATRASISRGTGTCSASRVAAMAFGWCGERVGGRCARGIYEGKHLLRQRVHLDKLASDSVDALQIRGFTLMEDDRGDFGIVVSGLGHDFVERVADGDNESVLRGGVTHSVIVL